MKIIKTVLLSVFVFLFVCSPAMMAQKKPDVSTSGQKSPVILLTCCDIKVVSFKATLISTQAGNPAVEFPHDKVLLEVILENAGGRAVPSDFLMDIFFKRNGEVIYGRGYPKNLGAPGSRFVVGDVTDSFPHGVKTTYSVEVPPLYNECSATNNQESFVIDETQLHRRLHK